MATNAWQLNREIREKIGELLVDICLGKETLPKGEAAGKAALQAKGVVFTDDVKGVLFHQNETDGVMHIAVPPKSRVQDMLDFAEGDPKKVADYIPFGQYDAIRNIIPQGSSNPPTDAEKEAAKQALYFRIGDYTISHCG